MRHVAAPDNSYLAGGSRRNRALALALAAAANLLLLVMLLRLAPPFGPPRVEERQPITIEVQPPPKPQVASVRTSKLRRAGGGAARHATAPRPTPASPAPAAPSTLQGVLMLSQQDYAAADIAKLPSHATETASSAAGNGNGAGHSSGDSEGAGQGPGGEQLYYADWFRPPSDAELAFYLKPNMPATGWGEIACRTVARFHVEDCQELGDSPPGSGFARAVREAAWQFLVKPPRIGGHALVGSWVRIRITYTRAGVATSRGG